MRTGRPAEAEALDELARAYGVQAAYTDGSGEAREAPPEAVAAALAALGAPLDGPDGALGALAEVRGVAASRLVEPVVVAWPGSETRVAVLGDHASCVVELEGGGERPCAVDGGAAVLPGALPVGYHALHVEAGGRRAEALVIAPPGRAPDPGPRAWGVFLPLYALPVEGPVAGFGDLGQLVQAMAARGAALVGTTPLYASFLDGEPFEPSPYSPASRLFWNDLFVDLAGLPELERSAQARAALEALPGPPADGLVDYRGTTAARRVVLQALADAAFADDGPRRAALEAYVAATPRLADYAGFRAAAEPDPEAARRRHAYAQWVAEQQLADVAREADAAGAGLYLDLPLGVHRAAYDVAAEPESFAVGIRAGAPPDVLGPDGQDWELPPLHPVGSRETGHRYTIACLRTALRHARALRIDHIAGFHRLFWIPEGFAATDGLYVRYPAEELYAIVLVEAHRRSAVIIGEDLGTVPPVVHETLRELGILRSYVLQFELDPEDAGRAPDPPLLSLAGLGTHDTATFAAWWQHGRKPRAAPAEASRRLVELGAGPARFVLASLEDLWDETRPQNVPGTTGGANWRRRARYDVAALGRLPVVDATFRALKEARP